ncbi:hypothetical protein GCM10023333_07740 [Ferrimonas pelagia]|uniref:Uncharacterized protein n=1 Tax=Ferrimonas pelagia TaxID=1177826 RepID=A0ABP9EFK5_9GAMM
MPNTVDDAKINKRRAKDSSFIFLLPSAKDNKLAISAIQDINVYNGFSDPVLNRLYM